MLETKNITLKLTEEQIKKGRLIALEVMGKRSLSGFLAYYITNYKLSEEKNEG